MELIKDTVLVERNIGSETSQILMEGDIIVPDTKPDIDVILQSDSFSSIDSFDISDNRVNFKGKLDINIIYLAKIGEKPIHSISFNAPINDFISIEGVDKNMWASVSCEITNTDYKIVNDRKISYRAVLDIAVKAEATEHRDIVVDINELPQNQIIKKKFVFNKVAERKSDRFTIKDELSVPSGKPNISDILQCCVNIVNKEVKPSDGKVNVSGILTVSTIYKSDTDESLIEFMENEIPFNGSLEANSVTKDMLVTVSTQISDKYVRVKSDDDGENRILDIEVSVSALIRAGYEKQIDVIEDVYCINKSVDIDSEEIEYLSFICRNKNQFPIKEIIQFNDDCPKILQVFKISGTNHLDDVRIIDDKIIVDGIINTDILYVASDDNTPVYCYNTVIPYNQVIETKGVKSNLPIDTNIDVSIEHIGFNMLSEKEMEIRCVLNFDVYVNLKSKINLITDIVFSDIDKSILDNIAGITIYTVKPGDTLWKIAKRYNTSIEDIVSVNDIEDPDKIYPGERFIILKNYSVCS